MRVISRKFHVMIDYITGVLLIASPWLFKFNDLYEAKWAAVSVGIVILIMSFFTDYEGGGKKLLSMKDHLNADIVIGAFLAVSPWLLNFYQMIFWPHLVIGLIGIIAGFCTVRESQHSYHHLFESNWAG